MTAEVFSLLEWAQVAVATCGLTVSGLEGRAIVRLRHAAEGPGQVVLAKQALFVEALRVLVHVVILGTALVSVSLPPPPPEMPHWIVDALVARKVGFLLVALIALAGTVSSRIARRAFQRAIREPRG